MEKVKMHKGSSFLETNYSDSLMLEDEQPTNQEGNRESKLNKWKVIQQWFEDHSIHQGYPQLIPQQTKMNEIKARGTLSLIDSTIHEKYERFKNRKFSVN